MTARERHCGHEEPTSEPMLELVAALKHIAGIATAGLHPEFAREQLEAIALEARAALRAWLEGQQDE